MNRLGPLDASFLHLEDEHNLMHIGSISIFEGPPPAYADFLAMVRGKLPLLPRYRQKVRFVPFGAGAPVWVEDPDFRLEYHVRHTALPRPGGTRQLRALVGRVLSQRLDRSKPLWEMWMVEGLEQDRWALVIQTHHAMVDGLASTEQLVRVLDKAPTPEEPVPDPWWPEREPSELRLLSDVFTESAAVPARIAIAGTSALRHPRRTVRHAATVARGAASFGRAMVADGSATSLNGPLGRHRRWATARTTLANVKEIRTAFGGTVNDVALSVTARGLRDMLLSRHQAVEGPNVRALVPVSARDSGDAPVTYDNRIAAMLVDLPVNLPTSLERLAAVKARAAAGKHSGQPEAAMAMQSVLEATPAPIVSLSTRLAPRLPQRFVQAVVTNVPGPREPLYACGRRLLEVTPLVPIANSVRVGVAVFSYAGTVIFGVTGDDDSSVAVDVVAHGIEVEIAELCALARRQATPASGNRAAPAKTAAAAAVTSCPPATTPEALSVIAPENPSLALRGRPSRTAPGPG